MCWFFLLLFCAENSAAKPRLYTRNVVEGHDAHRTIFLKVCVCIFYREFRFCTTSSLTVLSLLKSFLTDFSSFTLYVCRRTVFCYYSCKLGSIVVVAFANVLACTESVFFSSIQFCSLMTLRKGIIYGSSRVFYFASFFCLMIHNHAGVSPRSDHTRFCV